MKRGCGWTASTVLAMSLIVVPVAPADTELCGDLDGNGSIAASDALRLLNVAIGLPASIECPMECGATSTTTTTMGAPCDPADPNAYDNSPVVVYQCPALDIDLEISHWVFSSSQGTLAGSALPGVLVTLFGDEPVCPGGSFSLTGSQFGDCQVDYELAATYTTADTWMGSFNITLTGAACEATGCDDATFNLTGSR